MKYLGLSKSRPDSNQEHDSCESVEYPGNEIIPWKTVNEQPV